MDDGFDEEEDGDGETLANGKETKNRKRWELGVDVPLGSSVSEISEEGGAVWKVYVGWKLGHSLGPRFLSLLVLHVLVSFPPLGPLWSRFALQLLTYTRLSPAVDRTLVDYSSHLRLVVCDLVNTRSYVCTLNINSGRPKSEFAIHAHTGGLRSVDFFKAAGQALRQGERKHGY